MKLINSETVYSKKNIKQIMIKMVQGKNIEEDREITDTGENLIQG